MPLECFDKLPRSVFVFFFLMASPGNDELEKTNADAKHDLCSILCSPNRDYLIRNNCDQVKVDSLRGMVVGLYFSASWCGYCHEFTPDLVKAYNELVQENEFEIVFASADDDIESFNSYFSKMPWLAIPFSDSETRPRLEKLFGVDGYPHLVILDENGKVSTSKGEEDIQEYGVEGYPFTSERIKELKEQEEAARMNQSLKSLLVSQSRDYVITSDGQKVPVSDLAGKNILLYFADHKSAPCKAFLPKLIKTYQEINEEGNALEVIFISSDIDQKSFDEYFAEMPWLAIPFGDTREKSLSRFFKVEGLPTVVAIGPDGKTVSTDACELIIGHGPEAFPFTEERVKEIEEPYDEMAKMLPEKVKHGSHDHELVLTKHHFYTCYGCGEEGRLWSYSCEKCGFDLHLECAFENTKGKGGDEGKIPAAKGWICDGGKCYNHI